MGAVFGLDQISAARYRDEELLYTFGPATLGVGVTTVFDVSAWNPSDDPGQKVAILTSLAATQNSGVQLLWTYDGQASNQAQGWTDALPAGLRPWHLRAQAASRLSLAINNQTGAAINNFQLNYTIRVKALTVAEKLLYGYTLSDQDQTALNAIPPQNGENGLAQVRSLLQKGTLPIDFRRTVDALFLNRRQPDYGDSIPLHITIPVNSTSGQVSIPIRNGQYGILTELGVEGAPSVTVSLDRDSDYQYMVVNGAAFASANDAPARIWVPAKSKYVLRVTGSPGTYAIRPTILILTPSDLLTLHLGQGTTPAVSYAKVVAGLQ